MTANPRTNAALVEALGSALREGEHGLKTGPALLVRVLREESWRSFVTQRGEPVEYRRFEQFVTTPPLKGLGASMRLIKKLIDAIEDDVERIAAQDLLDQATQGKRGGSSKINLNVVNIHNEKDLERASGTSKEAGLRRLRKDRPDLHADVLAGTLSTHAAMVKAGFRQRKISVPLTTAADAAKAIRRNMDPEQVKELAKLLAAED